MICYFIIEIISDPEPAMDLKSINDRAIHFLFLTELARGKNLTLIILMSYFLAETLIL